MSIKNSRIVIIGGSSGIGLAIAKKANQEGAQVVIASRNLNKLESAKNQIGANVLISQVDIRNETSLKEFFNNHGEFEHLLISAAEITTGPFLSLSTEKAKAAFESKFWGSYNAAKYAAPFIQKNGSITFISGRLSQRPSGNGTAILSAMNSALEGLGRALALELALIRVNTLSPGLTRTQIYTDKSPEQLNKLCDQLLIKRPAEPEEIANAALYLMESTYTTGSTLFIDGGYTFR